MAENKPTVAKKTVDTLKTGYKKVWGFIKSNITNKELAYKREAY